MFLINPAPTNIQEAAKPRAEQKVLHSLYLPATMGERIRIIAAQKQTSVNAIVRTAVAEYWHKELAAIELPKELLERYGA